MEKDIVEFYLSLVDSDDAEDQTCNKFDIDEDTLNYILMCDFVETFSENWYD